jgi:hypothetical protein
MAIDTVQEPASDELYIASQGEVPPFGFYAEEVDRIALRVWQRSCCLEAMNDECCFCQGEAQRCLVCQ